VIVLGGAIMPDGSVTRHRIESQRLFCFLPGRERDKQFHRFAIHRHDHSHYDQPRAWAACNNCSALVDSEPVYTIQPVVKPVWQTVEQPVVSCIQTFNRLSNQLYNRFGNRFCRVYGVSAFQSPWYGKPRFSGCVVIINGDRGCGR